MDYIGLNVKVYFGSFILPKQRVGSSNLLSRSNLILYWSDKVKNPTLFGKFTPTRVYRPLNQGRQTHEE
jgi:hypothetical protein